MSNEASEDPGVDRAVQAAIRQVYDKGFAAGHKAGFTEGLEAAYQGFLAARQATAPADEFIAAQARLASLPPSATIEDLHLTTRTRNTLLRGGLNTISDLLMHSEAEVLEISRLHRKGLAELRSKLALNGYSLRPDQPAAVD